jgi:hypothetical protein
MTEIDWTGIAARYGTPTYVYDGGWLVENLTRPRAELHPSIEVFYSLKSNPNRGVYDVLRAVGSHLPALRGQGSAVSAFPYPPGVSGRADIIIACHRWRYLTPMARNNGTPGNTRPRRLPPGTGIPCGKGTIRAAYPPVVSGRAPGMRENKPRDHAPHPGTPKAAKHQRLYSVGNPEQIKSLPGSVGRDVPAA